MPSSFLKEKFFRSIDLNYIISLRANRNKDRMKFLSSGGNFDCFRIEQPGKMALALKISKESCFKEKSFKDWQSWIKDCERISSSELELCPPMLTMMDEVSVIQILPYGKDLRDLDIKQLKELEDRAVGQLANFGYTLGDVPQFKILDDQPFLVDFSELKRI